MRFIASYYLFEDVKCAPVGFLILAMERESSTRRPAIWGIGEVTKDNIRGKNTHAFIDISRNFSSAPEAVIEN